MMRTRSASSSCQRAEVIRARQQCQMERSLCQQCQMERRSFRRRARQQCLTKRRSYSDLLAGTDLTLLAAATDVDLLAALQCVLILCLLSRHWALEWFTSWFLSSAFCRAPPSVGAGLIEWAVSIMQSTAVSRLSVGGA